MLASAWIVFSENGKEVAEVVRDASFMCNHGDDAEAWVAWDNIKDWDEKRQIIVDAFECELYGY